MSHIKIKIGNIIRSDDLLDNIYRETEIYEQKKIVQVDYACVFTNGYSAIGALLNKYGQILMLSKLLLDEEEEVVETSITLEEIKLDVYIKIKIIRTNLFNKN